MRLDGRPRDAVRAAGASGRAGGRRSPGAAAWRSSIGGTGPAGAYPWGEQIDDRRRHTMAYSVPDLAYPFDALEPHIDARTMEIHHDKHHAAYVTNLNAALEGTEWMDRPIEAGPREPRDHPRGQARGRPQQRRRPREPHALLGDHGAGRRRRAVGRPRRGDRRHLRLARRPQGAGQRRGRQALRLRLELARVGRDGPRGALDPEPGLAGDRRARRRSSASTSGSTPTT